MVLTSRNMFVICGKPSCGRYARAMFIGDYLRDKLPDFKLKKIIQGPSDWKYWLRDVNLKYGWHHDKSPIIWKELVEDPQKPLLIGGLSEFLEYCFDYYGLDYIVPRYDTQNLVKDNMEFFESALLEERMRVRTTLKVCMTGNNIVQMNKLMLEIITAKIFTVDVLIIKLFNSSKRSKPLNVDTTDIAFEVIEDINDAIFNTDLLIITNDCTRLRYEKFYDWLERSKNQLLRLADAINTLAKKSLRIITATDGPVCFNATVLSQLITTINRNNIVALTSDAGLRVVNPVADHLDIPVAELSPPPVWGFIGINQIIDIDHMLHSCNIYHPNIRATKNDFGTTLSLGDTSGGMRFLAYLTHDSDNIWRAIKTNSDDSKEGLFSVKVKALISLLTAWYCPDNKDVISLGIFSEGSTTLPPCIVFSQPVVCADHKWIPLTTFPLPKTHQCDIQDLIPFIKEILQYFGFWCYDSEASSIVSTDTEGDLSGANSALMSPEQTYLDSSTDLICPGPTCLDPRCPEVRCTVADLSRTDLAGADLASADISIFKPKQAGQTGV